jgi:hypothetical protein
MTDEGDEIDELREQTRGSDRISAEVTDGESGEGSEDAAAEEDVTGDEADPEEEAEEVAEGGEGTGTGGPTPSEAFDDAFAHRAERTKGGVDPRSVSAEDPRLSAFLLALQDTGEIEEVGEAVRGALGAQEPPEYDRDALVRLALTYALHEEAPEYFERLAGRS